MIANDIYDLHTPGLLWQGLYFMSTKQSVFDTLLASSLASGPSNAFQVCTGFCLVESVLPQPDVLRTQFVASSYHRQPHQSLAQSR